MISSLINSISSISISRISIISMALLSVLIHGHMALPCIKFQPLSSNLSHPIHFIFISISIKDSIKIGSINCINSMNITTISISTSIGRISSFSSTSVINQSKRKLCILALKSSKILKCVRRIPSIGMHFFPKKVIFESAPKVVAIDEI